MISVIIPTFNREKTIKRAIDSVLNQTYKDIELIVVDDCSTDRTEEIINGYMDNRIKYYKLHQNSGACVARNKGVELSCGEYIAFQDSDDEWLENKLEKQLDFLEKNNSDICFCSLNNICLNGLKEIIPSKKVETEEIKDRLLKNNFISTQTIFGKKECFVDEKFDVKFPRFQDWDLVIRLSQKYKIVHCDEVLVNMYKQEDSMTYNFKKTVVGLQLIIDKYSQLMKKEDLSNIYFKLAKNQVLSNIKPDESLKESIKLSPDIKKVLYYVSIKTGFIKLYHKIKRRK